MGELPADLVTAARLGGEMGGRFAAYDWATHPLGPVSGWPEAYRTAVASALTSRFPIVLWLGAQDLYLVYNDAYLSVLGEKHPAALGMVGREVWWDIWESIGPMLAGVVETGTATWSDDLLLPVVTAGRPQERYFTFSYGPILIGSGRVDGIFCAVTETTGRVLGSRRLSILNNVATALMETRTVDDAVRAAVDVCADQPADLPVMAVYVDDPATGTTRLRAATPEVAGLLPATLSELAPGPAANTRVLDDLATRLPGLASAFPSGVPDQALVIPLPDLVRVSVGGALVVGVNPRQPLDDQYRGFCRLLGDQLTAVLATAALYERERQRADALAELDRAKTAFLANVSHEFRTPLTLLLGPVQDAMAEVKDQPAQLERLATVHRNALRLLRLVNSLLDFSRIEAGSTTANRVPVDLGMLTAQIASSFTELCQRAGLELIIRCPPAVAEVDAQMWETIVLNLLSNAVKFTFHGTITVEITRSGDKLVVQVADTGTGIPRAELDRLFDRFYRASNTRARSVEGTGIGLSLVRSLVELHDGTIELDSEVDVGTTVTIRLPAAPGAVPGEASRSSEANNPYLTEAMQWVDGAPAEPAIPAGGRPLVLIADDNPDMRRHLDRILAEHWDTVVYADGDAALRGVRMHHPDVVVTDVMMPGLDGLSFTAAIRADPLLAATPILMLSARAGQEAAAEGFSHGADDYLPKPFSSADLVNRVAARLKSVARDRASRERDEERAQRATALAEFRAALGAATTMEDVLSTVLGTPAGSLGATSAAVGLLENGHDRIRATYAGALPGELRDRYHLVALNAPVPMADVVRTGTPMTIPDTLDLDPRYELIVRDGRDSVRAAVIHPLRDAAGAVTGALSLYWAQPRPFDPPELDQVTRTAAAVGSALERIHREQRERRIASDFQDHLLDLDRGSTAAVVSAVYQPAGEAMRVGGDWYLVVPLEDPARVAISVGDVVSHGLPAATVMSKLRSAITAGALTDADPSPVLHLLERYAARVPGARCSTVAYAVVDTDTRTLSYACAGHLYPLLITPDGTARYLEEGRRPPLAARTLTGGDEAGYADLPTGSLVILYTDGLIERTGESLDDGFARLARAAADCATLPVDQVCTTLLSRLAPPGGYTDDVVVLALRPAGTTPDSFVATLPATRDGMPRLRHRLREWLGDLRVTGELEYDILLGAGEAVSNAIEHGSQLDSGKTVSVEAFADDERISITVSDSGQWSGDSSASRRASARGRGLTLINGLSERVDTVRTARGTQVTLHYRRDADPIEAEGVR